MSEENKPIHNEKVEQSEIPPSSGKVKPPGNEQQLNTSSTDETIPEAEQPITHNPFETGKWIGLKTKEKNPKWLGGNYSATWWKRNGVWKLRSELFVTLKHY